MRKLCYCVPYRQDSKIPMVQITMTKESLKRTKGFLSMWSFRKKFGDSRKVRMASRLYGKAVRLDEKGKPYEAIVMVCRALQAVRKSDAGLTEPDALSQVMTATTLFDKLATKVGRPEIVLTALREALNLCDRAMAADSRFIELVQPYRDRFHHRIGLIAAQPEQ